MESVLLNIKNMVCPRCIFAIENIMEGLGIQIKKIDLGYALVIIPKTVSIDMIKYELNSIGFELIQDKDYILVERIKILIIEYISYLEESDKIMILSVFITKSIYKNYNYLTKIFSFHCNRTIEQYYIKQRLRRVKELLDQDELNVTEISFKLRYSSVNYLSAQFKKYNGVSITQYKLNIDQAKKANEAISKAINELKSQGFYLDFKKKNNLYYCEEIDKYFEKGKVHKLEKYRYSYSNNHTDIATVSIINTDSNERGVYVEIPANNVNYSRIIL